MPNELILVDRVSKKFHRSWAGGILHGLQDFSRSLLHLKPAEHLRKDEFWALRDISFSVERGECLGLIGPNGAGKSTLLKLINREYRPDAGRLLILGPIKSLIRIGSGFHPLLSGRENIYIQCQQLGLGTRETDAKLGEIVAFAELEEAIDRPVKTYSDGMYARLEFSIATSLHTDILLVDEVLAVGDIAFQIRALDRLDQIKRNGTAIVFVSHSEMNIRQVADRCLLLFDGRQIGWGEPDALYYKYYESVGYLNRQLQPLGSLMKPPMDCLGLVKIGSLRVDESPIQTGKALGIMVEYEANSELEAALIVQFWNAAEVLIASVDSAQTGTLFKLPRGKGRIRLEIPFLSLTAGVYRLAAQFSVAGKIESYAGRLLKIHVVQPGDAAYQGLTLLPARFEQG
ncbi:MAG: ABC transporter ATP-binding protein [Methylococcaceae bacterium]|nr:ABC transporter ATP-binding protein [Methylococcaceae bacterium]